MVAGPNGAGKTTLVHRHGKLAARLRVINPDDIALAIDPERRNDPHVVLQAGREALQRRRQCLEEATSFLIETTLTGNGELTLLEKARFAGFKVNLAYVGLSRVDMSASRVSERVRRGGHDVAMDDIRRRFGRSLANLPLALARTDRAYLLDNTGLRHRLVYVVEFGRVKFRTAKLPSWVPRSLHAGRPGITP